MQLNDKIILITGASSGFGADAARLFAKEGAKVVLTARRKERLRALADEIRAEGGEALVIPVDLAKVDEILAMVQRTLEHYGRIDILFNNAGFGHLDTFENFDVEKDIAYQIDVNLTGLMQVTRAVLPQMLARGSGHIINMSSAAGWIALPFYSVYAAAKFGVRAFTDALRREVSHRGVYVTGIYPGPAETEFGKNKAIGSVSHLRHVPSWAVMSSEYVAEQVVKVAKKPRHRLILPWWFGWVIGFDAHCPRLSNWLQIWFAKKQKKDF